MNEITGAGGPSHLSELAAQQRLQRANTTRPAAGREIERAKDGLDISARGRAVSKLSSLPDVRTDMVSRLSKEVNNPDYDVDAKLALALDGLFGDVFGG